MNEKLYAQIEKTPARSAWKRGVREYALELLDGAEIELTAENVRKHLLNGAKDWQQYSEGGCAAVYDYDIAERLCNPTELKRTKGGELQPNSSENWIDVQARALKQAFNLIISQIYSMEVMK